MFEPEAIEAATFKVVLGYAWHANEKLARKIVHRLQRVPAVGLYDTYPHRSLWDEFCHTSQCGPSDDELCYGWDHTLHSHLQHVAQQLSRDEQLLLTAAAIDDLSSHVDANGNLVVSPELVSRGMMAAVVAIAMRRNLSGLDD